MSAWWLVPAFALGLAVGWLAYRATYRFGMRLAGRDPAAASDIVASLSNAALLKFRDSIEAEVAERDASWSARRGSA